MKRQTFMMSNFCYGFCPFSYIESPFCDSMAPVLLINFYFHCLPSSLPTSQLISFLSTKICYLLLSFFLIFICFGSCHQSLHLQWLILDCGFLWSLLLPLFLRRFGLIFMKMFLAVGSTSWSSLGTESGTYFLTHGEISVWYCSM